MTTLKPDYLKALESFFASASPMRHAQGASSPTEIEGLFAESQRAGKTLAQALAQAEDSWGRSQIEIQLMAAAAADLAIAGELIEAEKQPLRGDEDLWKLIKTGLTEPSALLQPGIRPAHYRGADRDLLATVYQVLNSIEESAIETVADAITGALTLNLAVLREATRMAGADLRQLLKDLGAEEATAFVGEALRKMLSLLGEDNLSHIEQTAGEVFEKVREKTAVASYIKDFLDTKTIYNEGRALVQAYDGPDKDLARLTPKILKLEGSFRGRNRLAATLIRLMAFIKLIPAMKTLPWGPLASASGYALIIAYELYSAHDHVDSDRFAFFDRVSGVRTLLYTLQPEEVA